MNITRRQLLCRTLGLSASVAFGAGKAFAEAADVEAAIKAIAAGTTVGEGTITLKAPETAENRHSVPIAVTVDSPMTADSFVESVSIFADGNPSPRVITFDFTPASGEAIASTRMRLAKSQNIIAVAKLSDGSMFSDTRSVTVADNKIIKGG